MKVLALALLVITVSSLEAGVVKRDTAAVQQVTDFFQSLFETLKTSTLDIKEKIENGELHAQAGQLLEQTKAKTEPLKEEMEKMFAKVLELVKQQY